MVVKFYVYFIRSSSLSSSFKMFSRKSGESIHMNVCRILEVIYCNFCQQLLEERKKWDEKDTINKNQCVLLWHLSLVALNSSTLNFFLCRSCWNKMMLRTTCQQYIAIHLKKKEINCFYLHRLNKREKKMIKETNNLKFRISENV